MLRRRPHAPRSLVPSARIVVAVRTPNSMYVIRVRIEVWPSRFMIFISTMICLAGLFGEIFYCIPEHLVAGVFFGYFSAGPFRMVQWAVESFWMRH